MNRRRKTATGHAVQVLFGACLVVPAYCGSVKAADFREPGFAPYGADASRPGTIVEIEPPPRYFPRAEEDSTPRRYRARPRRLACIPRSVPIPTDAPDDPSYVGSTYGLGKPSYYGIKPALGVDDPFGRSLLPYCN